MPVRPACVQAALVCARTFLGLETLLSVSGGCSMAAADMAARETRPRAVRAIALNGLQGAEEQGVRQAVVAAAFQQVLPPLLLLP